MASCGKVAWQIRRLGARINDARGQLSSTKALSARDSVKDLAGRLGIDFKTMREDATGLLDEGLRLGGRSFHEDSFTRKWSEGRRGSGLGRFSNTDGLA
jgi:hypothetical protein